MTFQVFFIRKLLQICSMSPVVFFKAAFFSASVFKFPSLYHCSLTFKDSTDPSKQTKPINLLFKNIQSLIWRRYMSVQGNQAHSSEPLNLILAQLIEFLVLGGRISPLKSGTVKTEGRVILCLNICLFYIIL